ncbi:unnamed protein product, partial [Prorocentrum cordatum]
VNTAVSTYRDQALLRLRVPPASSLPSPFSASSFPALAGQEYATQAKVEYYSASQGGWILARVEGYNADGTYNLDCKPNVAPDKIRWPGGAKAQAGVGADSLAATIAPNLQPIREVDESMQSSVSVASPPLRELLDATSRDRDRTDLSDRDPRESVGSSHSSAPARPPRPVAPAEPPPVYGNGTPSFGDRARATGSAAPRGGLRPGSGALGSGALGSGALGSGALGSGALGSGALGSSALPRGAAALGTGGSSALGSGALPRGAGALGTGGSSALGSGALPRGSPPGSGRLGGRGSHGRGGQRLPPRGVPMQLVRVMRDDRSGWRFEVNED